jgi:hypothetical protein
MSWIRAMPAYLLNSGRGCTVWTMGRPRYLRVASAGLYGAPRTGPLLSCGCCPICRTPGRPAQLTVSSSSGASIRINHIATLRMQDGRPEQGSEQWLPTSNRVRQ